MDEKQREYCREWRRKNRDRVKRYQIDKAIREVIAAIEAGRVEIVNRREIRTRE